jgi:2-methylisocitrate lyase-like PEP mutase family enzyme
LSDGAKRLIAGDWNDTQAEASQMRSQLEKAKSFRALHERPGAFIIPNPWDAGTAKLLATMGFEALATTSLGLANMLGQGGVSLQAII